MSCALVDGWISRENGDTHNHFLFFPFRSPITSLVIGIVIVVAIVLVITVLVIVIV